MRYKNDRICPFFFSMAAAVFSILCASTYSLGADESNSSPSAVSADSLKTFEILPLGKIDEARVRIARRAIEETFVCRVLVDDRAAMPKDAYVPSRGRWLADSLLDFLAARKMPASVKIIGLTDEDICTPSRGVPCWGIFGLGALGGKSCVVSGFRLGFRAESKKAPDRLEKVVIHEVGHTFGLDHCPTVGCIMEDAQGTIRTVDRERVFCPACQNRLGRALRTDSKFSAGNPR